MNTTKIVGLFADSAALIEPQDLLSALLRLPTVGLGICDKQLRFRAVNKALASMNGVAPQAHIGKTIRAVLGSAAVALEAPVRHVFSSGRGVSNLEICAKLSTRAEVGYWILNYFPIKDAAGGVILVGKVAVEITDQKKVQQSLRSVTDNLIRNLLLTARDSDVLLRQIMGGSLRQVPSSGANRNRFAVRGLSNPPSVCSLDAMPPVSESGSEPDANAKLRAVALTAKEREVVKLLVKGNGNKGTAAILHISVKTVEAHRERIMLKLGLHSTKELMRHAISEKIVDPADF